MSIVAPARYRISGHESFACRYAWLPKAVRGLQSNPQLFSDEEQAMLDLGVGKNMVRSIRFWVQATAVASTKMRGSGLSLTEFGRAVLSNGGHDEFLEDIRTLWLLHWNLSTDVSSPLLAWDYLLNRWHEPELVPSRVIHALQREALRQDEGLSRVTIDQHWDTFLHTYLPTRGRKGAVQEDNLDSPFTELELIIRVGERPAEEREGRAEPVFAFRREEKADITPELFVYALVDFWSKRHAQEGTLSLREIAHGHGGPGQVFKLPEEDIRDRVEALERQTQGFLAYAESANIQTVRRHGERKASDLLHELYR